MSVDFEQYGRVSVNEDQSRIEGHMTMPGYEKEIMILRLDIEATRELEISHDKSLNTIATDFHVDQQDLLGMALLVNEVKQRTIMQAYAIMGPEKRNRSKTFFSSKLFGDER